jgi:adhesin HecA-like repeat protein
MKKTWSKKIRVLPAIMLILSIGLISAMVSSALAEPPDMVKVLIGFKSHPGPDEEALVHSKGGEVKRTYRIVPAIAARVPSQALAGLRKNPNITAVEPDLEVHVIDAELDNTWGVKRIGAGTIHDSGNKGYWVKVAVLDTGIDTDHPDLTYDPTCSTSFVDGEALEDGHGHGTHTAGTVAALDNDTGVVGAAPDVTLCIYKVLSNSGSGNYSDIIAALEQAVADGVQITNNSYGGSGDPGSIVKAAFDNSYAAGVLNIAAAGNNGNAEGTGDNCIFPARWDSVVAVAATTQSDVRPYFSSTCPEVELAAPGYQIRSTVPGGGYGIMSGTSMASPHVAGTAALVLAAHRDWTNNEVRFQLQSTALDLGSPGRDVHYGYGLVDAVEATGGFANSPPTADNQDVVTTQNTPVDITLTGSDPESDPLTFSVLAAPSHGTLSGTAPDVTYTPATGFRGSDSFTFKANDGLLDSAAATVSLTVTDTVAIAKAAYNAKKKTLSVEATSSANGAVILTATAFDSNGNPLGSKVLSYNTRKHNYTGTITGLSSKPFRVKVTSSGGGSDSVEGAEIGG